MSGIGEIGGLSGANTTNLRYVQPKDIDVMEQYIVEAPSVSPTYMALGTNGGGGGTALVIKSATPDYPRNFLYQVTGGTVGGTFTAVGADQFGNYQTETVAFATAATGGSASGTAIWGSLTSAIYYPAAANNGTPSVGFGTKTGGPATAGANWFGLPVKIGGTQDVKTITWIANTTATPIQGGTNVGALVGNGGTVPQHAFQGTSGVAVTDKYIVNVLSTYDNVGKGNLVNF